ncbi:MAG: DUF983 domain-containing protein [Hellea sp.]|nr:DUF983 domain-containing protein [Hellea sp.]
MLISNEGLSPFITGLRGACPKCGEGKIFKKFLTFEKNCLACGESFPNEDAGDGPAVFVIFIVSIFIVPMALGFSMVLNAPMWLTFAIWIPIIVFASLFLLRVMRGVIFNLQWKHKALEIKSSEIDL